MKKLPLAFFTRPAVVAIANELIGKILVTNFGGEYTSGRIVESEAYEGTIDRASHAFRGRTPRTSVMFDKGGIAYVYLCYGIHQMFNIVTGPQDLPHAILIRALEPIEGLDIMLKRAGKQKLDYTLTKGPGNVGKAMGFLTSQSGKAVTGSEIFLLDDGFQPDPQLIIAAPRVGVDYAGEHALWPYRFYLKGSNYVSGKIK